MFSHSFSFATFAYPSFQKDKYLDLARELKKTVEHVGNNYTNCNWCVWNSN